MQWLKATRDWVTTHCDFIVACAAVAGVIVSISALRSQIEMAKSQTEVTLSRELAREFLQVGEAGKESLYQRMRNAIAGNEWLYRWARPEVRKWARNLELCTHQRRPNHEAGKPLFNDDEINQYLNFLDDLNRYYKSGMLSLETVDLVFGPYIVQAYENLELKRYVALSRIFMCQPMAFKGFESLAEEIKARPGEENLATPWQEVYAGCELKPKARTREHSDARRCGSRG